MTMPDWSTTATFCDFSLVFIMRTDGRMHSAAKRIGTTKVVIRKDFFLTLVIYSLPTMTFMFLRFILCALRNQFDEYVVHSGNQLPEGVDLQLLGKDRGKGRVG